jgi:hypothetical protein
MSLAGITILSGAVAAWRSRRGISRLSRSGEPSFSLLAHYIAASPDCLDIILAA